MKLALAEERTPEEERLVELLERLVDDYDERRTKDRLQALDPMALLQHLMEEGGLRQVDLVDCFGSQSVVSAVVAGRRQINSEHARRLSQRFGLPINMFLR
jgi:HTH-type transcriptional regulator/antitoxin HigA